MQIEAFGGGRRCDAAWCVCVVCLCGRLQVCREWQRGSCTRLECRYAHPTDPVSPGPDNTVTVCMDALNGRCTRNPCRYFHPPLHLQAIIKAAHSVCTFPITLSFTYSSTLSQSSFAPIPSQKALP